MIHNRSFESDEFLKTIINDEKLRNRCISNNNFLLYIITKNGLRLEIIAPSYNDFKYILNGISFLIKELESLVLLSNRIEQTNGI